MILTLHEEKHLLKLSKNMIGLPKPHGISYINLEIQVSIACFVGVFVFSKTGHTNQEELWTPLMESLPRPHPMTYTSTKESIVDTMVTAQCHLLLNWTRSEVWMQTCPPLARTSRLDNAGWSATLTSSPRCPWRPVLEWGSMAAVPEWCSVKDSDEDGFLQVISGAPWDKPWREKRVSFSPLRWVLLILQHLACAVNGRRPCWDGKAIQLPPSFRGLC